MIAPVIIFPRGQLNAKDKERLTKMGVVAVEADEPSKVVILSPSPMPIQTNDMFVAALEAMTGQYVPDSVAMNFAKGMLSKIKERDA